MYTRRRAVALAALGIGALSGCSDAADLATGNGPIEQTASPAVVAEAAISDTAYELSTQEERTLEREVSAGGETRTIIATNQFTRYEKAGEDSPGVSSFSLLTTPGFSFAGQPLNPVADWSNEELLAIAAEEFDGLRDASEATTLTKSVLGSQTTISKFDAVSIVAGQAVDVSVYVTSVANEGDVVIGIGGYPQPLDSRESSTVESFFTDIEHPVEL